MRSTAALEPKRRTSDGKTTAWWQALSGQSLLFTTLLTTLLLRLLVIVFSPDSEPDAFGHVRIARALLTEPGNLHVHWVWLPAPHFVMAGLLALGLGHEAMRWLNTLVFVASPLALWAYVRWRLPDAREASTIALVAALFWALVPVSNRVATSAQPETVMALLLLLVVWALEARQGLVAGLLLAVGCLSRYECWAAVAGLACLIPLQRVQRRTLLAAVLPPCAAVAGWVLVRHAADGTWLWYVRHTIDFSREVRQSTGLAPIADLLLVPMGLVLLALGPLAVCAPFGVRPMASTAWAAPAAITLFLVVAYVFRGIPALDRYLVELVPFACIAAARAVVRFSDLPVRWRWLSPLVVLALLLLSGGLYAIWSVLLYHQSP